MDTAQDNMSDNDAHQESGPDASTAPANSRLAIDNAQPPRLPILANARKEPSHTTVEHNEIRTTNGSTH